MSTNRNKEEEQAHLLKQVKEYIQFEGVVDFVLDLKYLYPEVYDELLQHFNHVVKSQGEVVVPALLRNYRK
jgi:hypothetical protein